MAGPGIDPEALERAEAALSKLSSQYLAWAEADAASLRACLAEVQQHPSEAAAALAHLAAIAHDMKGQAATFGYPLVTELARRVCGLLAGRSTLDPDTIALLSRHVDALSEVLTRRLGGNGGDAGAEILARLD